jgi:pimeloyl-ACP methyl ester carboxylesterase
MTAPSLPRKRSRARRAGLLAAASILGPLLLGLAATRLLVARAEREYPPLGTFVEVGGTRQHVVERGSGPPVVLVHGAFGGLQDFSATIQDELARRYRTVAWDRPGHGYSERAPEVDDPGDQAEVLLELVRALRLERPLLVGFSYGGAVALAAALLAPLELRGVVLVNSPSHPWPEPTELKYSLPLAPVLGPLLTETLVTPLGALLARASVEQAFAPLPVPEAFARSPVLLALRPEGFRANAEDMRALKPFLEQQVSRYPGLAVPVTLIVGTGDRVVSPTLHGPALSAASKRVRVIEVEGAGHQLLYTQGGVVVGAVDEAMAAAGG